MRNSFGFQNGKTFHGNDKREYEMENYREFFQGLSQRIFKSINFQINRYRRQPLIILVLSYVYFRELERRRNIFLNHTGVIEFSPYRELSSPKIEFLSKFSLILGNSFIPSRPLDDIYVRPAGRPEIDIPPREIRHAKPL